MLIFQPEIKERTNVPDNQGTATVLLRFVSLRSASTKIGDVKMDRHDRELLDKQMRRRLMPCLRRTNNALRFASLSISWSTTHPTSMNGFKKRGATLGRNIAIGISGQKSARRRPTKEWSSQGCRNRHGATIP